MPNTMLTVTATPNYAASTYVCIPRVEQPVRECSVAAEQQEPAAVRVQAPYRVMPNGMTDDG